MKLRHWLLITNHRILPLESALIVACIRASKLLFGGTFHRRDLNTNRMAAFLLHCVKLHLCPVKPVSSAGVNAIDWPVNHHLWALRLSEAMRFNAVLRLFVPPKSAPVQRGSVRRTFHASFHWLSCTDGGCSTTLPARSSVQM